MTKYRGLVVPISVWVVAFAGLAVALRLLNVSSVVQGGALGAFCGATIVVVMTVHERAKAKDRPVVHERYR